MDLTLPCAARAAHRQAGTSGTLGTEGGEVWVYAGAATEALAAIRRALRWRPVPDGTHVLVRTGDEKPVRVELR